MKFSGADYNPAYDDARLEKQLGRVFEAMRDGAWRTFREIAAITGDPEASISAQLRHLREEKHGGHTVDKRARGNREGGLYEYRLTVAAAPKPGPQKPVRTEFFKGQGFFTDVLA